MRYASIRDGRMFVADYKKHNIFLVGPDGKAIETYFHSDDFNQPNDITIAADGTIYASDPHWKRREGQIWRISKSADGTVVGERMAAERRMSTTNGIDLSIDGRTLYVGESDTREIWAYRIDGARLLSPRLVKRFDDFGIDGLRIDTEGNLYVARILKGTIAVLTPEGKLKREISSVQRSRPTSPSEAATARRFSSRSGRAASSNCSAPTAPAGKPVLRRAQGQARNRNRSPLG